MKVYPVGTSRGDCLVRARTKRRVEQWLRREFGRSIEPITIYPDKERDRIKSMGAGVHHAY